MSAYPPCPRVRRSNKMTKSARDAVVSVVTVMSGCSGYEDMIAESDAGMRWLERTTTTLKRKILEGAGIAHDGTDAKKFKIVDGSVDVATGKENDNLNVGALIGKPQGKQPAEPQPAEYSEMDTEDKSHPDDEIDVYGMKVSELRSELKSRELETSGLKKALQGRLADAIEAAREERERDKEERSQRDEALAQEELHRRQEEAEMELEQQSLGTVTVGAIDFPGVGVSSKSVSTDDESREDAMEVEPAQASEEMHEISNHDKPSCYGGEMVYNASGVIGMEKADSTQVMRVSMSTSDQDVGDRSNSSCDDEESMQEVTAAARDMQNSSSLKKRNLGQKIIKATAKLFSPSNKREKSQLKVGKLSPTKLLVLQKSMPGKSLAREEPHEEKDDKIVLGLPPPPLHATLQQPAIQHSQLDQIKAQSIKKASEVSSSSSSLSTTSLLKTPAVGPKPGKKGESNSSTETTASVSTISSTASAFSKSTEAKKKAILEARSARLAALRAQSKPAELTTLQKAKLAAAGPSAILKAKAGKNVHGTNQSSVHHIKKAVTAESKQKEEKRKQLAAQMREKAAAAKARKKDGEQRQNESRPVDQAFSQAKMKETEVLVKPKIQQQAQSKPKQLSQAPQAPKPLPLPLRSPSKMPQEPPKVLSPMDTYEISDRDSDSESEDFSDSEDEKSPKKKIPKWAQKSNLIPALEKQFMEGPDRIDPDEIFPEVSTCDLASVFDQKKASKYQKRASTGNWNQDKVTIAEKLVYKRTMGFK